jgi:hypothetical protein
MPVKNNKFLIGLAFLFLIVASLQIIDWMVFCNRNRSVKDFTDLMQVYKTRFPSWYGSHLRFATGVWAVFLYVAGFVFIRQQKKFYTILAVLCFILGFWNLFSLM